MLTNYNTNDILFYFSPIVIIVLLLFYISAFYFFMFKSFYFVYCGVVLRKLVILAIFLDLVLFFGVFNEVYIVDNVNLIFFNFFKFEKFSVFSQVMVMVIFLLIFLINFNYDVKKKINSFEAIFLNLCVLIGSVLLVVSNDLVISYLLIELQSIPIYILLSSFRNSKKCVEASIKYFFLSSISTSLLLFGVSLIYYFSGFTNYNEVGIFLILFTYDYVYIINNMFLFIGFSFIIISVLFKLSAAPLHFWLSDVYDGAPISIILLFSVVPKYSVFIFFINLLYGPFFSLLPSIKYVIILLGILSVFVGTVSAFFLSKIARVLAYGSVSHIGFALIALGCYTADSIFVACVYMFSYITATLLFFLVWLNIQNDEGDVKFISELQGCVHNSKATAFILLTSLFSFAGIPPLFGFFSKFLVIVNLATSYSIALSIFLFFISVISAVYYLRFIKFIFFFKSDIASNSTSTSSKFGLPIFLSVLFAVILIFSVCFLLVLYH